MSIRLWSNSQIKKKRFYILRAVVITLMLSTSIGRSAYAQNPSWAKEFVGNLTFSLMDDLDYKQDYNSMVAVEQELQSIRVILKDKRAQLENANNEKLSSISSLEANQYSLGHKIDLRDRTELEIDSLENQHEAVINLISSNTKEISIKQSELNLLNDQIDLVQSDFDDSVLSEQAKKKIYKLTLNNCIENNPGIDCTQNKDVVYAAEMLTQSVERKKFVENQLAGLTNLANNAQAVIDEKTEENEAKEIQKVQIIGTIANKGKVVDNLKTQIPQLQALTEKLTGDISELSILITVLTQDEQRLNDLDVVNALNFERADQQFKRLEKALVGNILLINKEAVAISKSHGNQEGFETANSLGTDFGSKDGQEVGSTEGETAGRARDYEIGAKLGAKDGQQDGEIDGKNDGVAAGIIWGNRIAGAQVGEIDGINRANADNSAISQGTADGNILGLDQAKVQGKIIGYADGEKISIENNESIKLSQVIANGDFSGTFSAGIPILEKTSKKYFNNKIDHSKQVLRLAYAAAYDVSYDAAVYTTFNLNITDIYSHAFNFSKNLAYQASYSLTHTDSIRRGRLETYQTTYDQFYAQSRTTSFDLTQNMTISDPNNASVAYQNAYAKNEQSSYQNRFSERKKKSKEIARKKTYADNIFGIIKQHTETRVTQVDKIYQNYPILKFISATIKDNGQSEVGKADGIYQPGEKLGLDMVIVNYGKTSAKNIKVITNSGQTFILPEILGMSQVTVKDAVNERISQNIKLGTSKTIKTTTTFELTSTDKNIQGKFFADKKQGILNLDTHKAFVISNPFGVKAIAVQDALEIGKEKSLSLDLTNLSSRGYTGPIKVEITSNLGKSIITKQFNSLTAMAVSSSVKLLGARVQIDNADEIFSEVDFSVVISKNGITLASASNIGESIVQMPYVEKKGAVVVAISSEKRESRQLFKDVATELGGAGNVSVLDLNNNKVNVRILKKLNGKTVIVIGNADMKVESQLNDLFDGDSNVALVINDLSASGSLNRIKKLANLVNASALDIVIGEKALQLITTNKFNSSTVKNRVTAIELDSTQIDSVLYITDLLKLSNTELLQKASSIITFEALRIRNQKALDLSKIIISRLLEEVQLIDNTCTTRKECRGLKKFIKNDTSIFANQIIDELERNSDNAKGVLLIGQAIEDAVSTYNKKDHVKFLSLRRAFKLKAHTINKLAKKLAKKQLGKS
jgi:hypothetical protein